MDIELLSLLSNRDRFDQYGQLVISNKGFLSEGAQMVLRHLKAYYDTVSSDTIKWTSFGAWLFLTKCPDAPQDKRDIVLKLLTEADQHIPDPAVQDNIIHSLIERKLAEELTVICEEISLGSSKYGVDDLQRKVKEFADTTAHLGKSPNVVTDDIDELLGAVLDGGLYWKQLWMNKSCGPLRRGDFVCLVARPDSGKTSFLSGQANSFAKQAESPVLWINNEQEGKKVKLRILQEAINLPNADMKLNPQKAREKYEAAVGSLDKVVVVDKAGVTCQEIEALCEEYEPCAIIIDQLWKVKGFGADNSDVRVQTQVANWARELCKKWAPVIGVYQADATAEGKEYFGMECIYQSKTAVQGEADLIICMGRVHEQGKEDIRYFHFPKHKLSGGGPHFQSKMKSWKHESQFNPETGVFK